jgi:hypothetical protein
MHDSVCSFSSDKTPRAALCRRACHFGLASTCISMHTSYVQPTTNSGAQRHSLARDTPVHQRGVSSASPRHALCPLPSALCFARSPHCLLQDSNRSLFRLDRDHAGHQAVISLGPLFPRRPYLICSRFLNILHPTSMSSGCSHWRTVAVTPTGTVSLLLAHAAPGNSNGERHRQNLNRFESVHRRRPPDALIMTLSNPLDSAPPSLHRGCDAGARMLEPEDLSCMSSST